MSPDSNAESKWATRLERERRARRQAEQLAESGMRELWLVNQTLEQKVQERTIALDRSMNALAESGRVRQALFADLGNALSKPLTEVLNALGRLHPDRLLPSDRAIVASGISIARQLESLLTALQAVSNVDTEATELALETRDPSRVIDELIHRWQRRAARRGLLLVGTSECDEDVVLLQWQRLVLALDTLLDSTVQHGNPGTLHVKVLVSASNVVVTVEDAGPLLPAEIMNDPAPTSLTFVAAGQRGVGLAVVKRMTDEDDSDLKVATTEVGGLHVELSTPRPSPAEATLG